MEGRRHDTSDVLDFHNLIEISSHWSCFKFIPFIQHNLPTELYLAVEPAILQLLPVELVMHLKMPVLPFWEMDVYGIHRARWTRTDRYQNPPFHNDWVSVRAGREHMHCVLRAGLPPNMVSLITITHCRQDTVQQLAGLWILTAVNSG